MKRDKPTLHQAGLDEIRSDLMDLGGLPGNASHAVDSPMP
jgi:hypothetical protein